MLSYEQLKDKAREFLDATGLTVEELQKLLPAFEVAYEKRYPRRKTLEGKPRQWRVGAGAKGVLCMVKNGYYSSWSIRRPIRYRQCTGCNSV